MRLPLLISLSLLLLALATAHAQPLVDADEFFHGGAQLYLSNNVPAALGVVTNGRAQFPDDAKLKKLEELLKQKQQEQQQQDQQKQEQEKKDEQKKEQDKKDQQKKDEQDKQDKQDTKDDQQKPQPSKPDKKDSGDKKEPKPKPGQMTPAQAARLRDGQKGEEEALVFKPEGKPKDDSKPVKDW